LPWVGSLLECLLLVGVEGFVFRLVGFVIGFGVVFVVVVVLMVIFYVGLRR